MFVFASYARAKASYPRELPKSPLMPKSRMFSSPQRCKFLMGLPLRFFLIFSKTIVKGNGELGSFTKKSYVFGEHPLYRRGELLGRRSSARSSIASVAPPSREPLCWPLSKEAPQSARSRLSDKAHGEIRQALFFAHLSYSQVYARSARMGTGERESGRDIGQQLMVRGLLS